MRFQDILGKEALAGVDNNKSYIRMDVIWKHLFAILPKRRDLALNISTVPYGSSSKE